MPAHAEALWAVHLPASFRDKLALRTTWLDKQVKEGRQESPATLALLAYVQPLLKQLILELFLRGALHWHRRAVGRVSGHWHSSCSTGSGEDTGKQLSREINITVTHHPEQLWHIYGYGSSVCRALGIAVPQCHRPPAPEDRAEVDTNMGASPLAAGPWAQAHSTTSIPSPPTQGRAQPDPAGTCHGCPRGSVPRQAVRLAPHPSQPLHHSATGTGPAATSGWCAGTRLGLDLGRSSKGQQLSHSAWHCFDYCCNYSVGRKRAASCNMNGAVPGILPETAPSPALSHLLLPRYCSSHWQPSSLRECKRF